jgi:prevent-host-death family protein
MRNKGEEMGSKVSPLTSSHRAEVNIHEAKTNLSRLLARVSTGEEIVIARAGRPIARLVPWSKPLKTRVLGLDAGRVRIASDFDAPLPDEVLEEFEG